jgi:LPS-assembly protein
MLRAFLTIIVVLAAIGSGPATVHTQTPQSQIGGCRVSQLQGATQEALSKEIDGKTETVLVLTGSGALAVRVDCDETQFYADFVEIYQDRNRVVATGNVTVVSSNSRISAERVEFNTKSRTGTFYVAHGWVSLGDRVDRSMFGTQEPDAMFRGREIHKIGPKKYRIVDGAFSTCMQPTPRWEMVSGSATLTLDDYVLLKNSVFRVKGVPLMYMPIFYYPMEEDDRSTGFLIPVYGTSTLRGQSWSFPFFWAINRSQDATFAYDWFSKAGQQMGGEYRYVLGPGSQGNATTTLFKQNDQTSTGGPAAGRSYRIDGSMVQNLGGGLRAQARANYFSDVSTQQLYQQDVYRATQSTRNFGGNISGNWREYVLSGTLNRYDVFNADGSITTDGGLPRISFSRGERRIGRAPLYFGVNSEYATILRSRSREDVTESDQGLTRVDVNPVVRIPFTRWQFLTVNSSIGWRGTYWSESVQREDGEILQAQDPLQGQYFDFNARITGPVLTRIFQKTSDPDGKKLKHVIEPYFTVGRVTGIDIFDQIVKLDSIDYLYGNGGTTRFQYGLVNRLYSKKTVAREILNVNVFQSYYTKASASRFDPQYQNSFEQRRPSNYTPIALMVRTLPSDRVQADFKTEWDPTSGAFLSFTGNGVVNSTHLQASAGWTQQRFLPPALTAQAVTTSHALNATVNWRNTNNRIGGTYSLYYDLLRDTFLQQRYFAYYNAQCCGVLVEYQVWDFPGSRLVTDRRFNVSFTLAGIGTFSNFLGAFGAQSGR